VRVEFFGGPALGPRQGRHDNCGSVGPQFHLWAFPPGERIPVGFPGPDDEDADAKPESGFRQRPL
jgi:hypothetical protein